MARITMLCLSPEIAQQAKVSANAFAVGAELHYAEYGRYPVHLAPEGTATDSLHMESMTPYPVIIDSVAVKPDGGGYTAHLRRDADHPCRIDVGMNGGSIHCDGPDTFAW